MELKLTARQKQKVADLPKDVRERVETMIQGRLCSVG